MKSDESTMPTISIGSTRERKPYQFLLQQIEGHGAPRWIRLDRPELVMGRALEADISLPQPASRQHAFLRTENGECLLLDNNSRNGVFLNGLRIYSAMLRHKDIIQVASCAFMFHEP